MLLISRQNFYCASKFVPLLNFTIFYDFYYVSTLHFHCWCYGQKLTNLLSTKLVVVKTRWIFWQLCKRRSWFQRSTSHRKKFINIYQHRTMVNVFCLPVHWLFKVTVNYFSSHLHSLTMTTLGHRCNMYTILTRTDRNGPTYSTVKCEEEMCASGSGMKDKHRPPMTTSLHNTWATTDWLLPLPVPRLLLP